MIIIMYNNDNNNNKYIYNYTNIYIYIHYFMFGGIIAAGHQAKGVCFHCS